MNPKKKKDSSSLPFDDFVDPFEVISSTECTGLIPTPSKTEAESEAYTDLYDVHQPKNKKIDSLKRDRACREQS